MSGSAGEQTSLEPGRQAALLGQRVAFTGRFAGMTRAQAERLVAGARGRVVAAVGARTTMLVVGMRGWPLMESGQVTAKLAAAERLREAGGRIRVVSEIEFREALGLDAPPRAGPKPIDAGVLCATLGIDEPTLRRWEHCGLVRAHDGRFDFQDLVSLRTVTDLVARGVSPVVIRRSLDALRAFLPGVDRPLAQLKILLSDSGRLVAELEEALLTTSGQLEIRFDAPGQRSAAAGASLTLRGGEHRDSAAWIDAGVSHEEAGDLDEAERAYRRAAALAPADPTPQFNLGNVLLARGRLEAAAERFAQAAALDPSHARAWFNLAHAQDALGEREAAMKHLRKAIAADPSFADAHFNLADLAERLGDAATASEAWSRYIRLDGAGEWGAAAKRRLAALRGEATWA